MAGKGTGHHRRIRCRSCRLTTAPKLGRNCSDERSLLSSAAGSRRSGISRSRTCTIRYPTIFLNVGRLASGQHKPPSALQERIKIFAEASLAMMTHMAKQTYVLTGLGADELESDRVTRVLEGLNERFGNRLGLNSMQIRKAHSRLVWELHAPALAS